MNPYRCSGFSRTTKPCSRCTTGSFLATCRPQCFLTAPASLTLCQNAVALPVRACLATTLPTHDPPARDTQTCSTHTAERTVTLLVSAQAVFATCPESKTSRKTSLKHLSTAPRLVPPHRAKQAACLC